jgi:hypothetical protein
VVTLYTIRARAAVNIIPLYGRAKLAAAVERHLKASTGQTVT